MFMIVTLKNSTPGSSFQKRIPRPLCQGGLSSRSTCCWSVLRRLILSAVAPEPQDKVGPTGLYSWEMGCKQDGDVDIVHGSPVGCGFHNDHVQIFLSEPLHPGAAAEGS